MEGNRTRSAPDGFVQVSKDQFFATVGQLNVHPCSRRDYTPWKLHAGAGRLVGWSSQGYVPQDGEEERFYVAPDVLKGA